eukprot:2741548-Prymnesium_polylepis.1
MSQLCPASCVAQDVAVAGCVPPPAPPVPPNPPASPPLPPLVPALSGFTTVSSTDHIQALISATPATTSLS